MSERSPDAQRMRIRELLPYLHLGDFATGPLNSLTDVPGVKVNTQELFSDDGTVNTGVTSILPHETLSKEACYAGTFTFNGSGELTGAHMITDMGILYSPIILTGTLEIGAAHQGIFKHAIKASSSEKGEMGWLMLPMVGETCDGYLHDCTTFAVKPEHIITGLENATAERVREGNTGGGTGMVCHRFKGGTGSSSRIVPRGDSKESSKGYTIAALVQANHGKMKDLRIGGVPIGWLLEAEAAKDEARKADLERLARVKDRNDGSILVILATDAPLHPLQLQRIAKRATVGLARVGGHGHNISGDIFLAFSTGNSIPVDKDVFGPGCGPTPLTIQVIEDSTIDNLFDATADVTEEAIYNALCMAETMTGYQGRTVEALPLDRVKEIMDKFYHQV
ncbi:putative D-stereospecific aminopeptidase [Microsporum canis]|uniref:Peptidase family T4 protein n=1 Tax=Arthroderma otae (strain ATCC MYA-4605 / CBS 113480) TaxID=554155 RepID=C5FR14_ARTOC|nr:peptidase family T4 protein [Microsporum canis CBS 113480]EEQ32317.1 peptidase family T4 protein [Microsporum canis CBS 113480]